VRTGGTVLVSEFEYCRIVRRDDYTLDVEHSEWVEEGGDAARPELRIGFRGSSDELSEWLTRRDGELLDASETDVAFRLLGRASDEETTGVLGLTNRITGDFIVEVNESAWAILQFVTATRRYGEESDSEGEYLIRLETEDEEDVLTYQKSTFLVYTEEGELLREHSLIPSGVEL